MTPTREVGRHPSGVRAMGALVGAAGAGVAGQVLGGWWWSAALLGAVGAIATAIAPRAGVAHAAGSLGLVAGAMATGRHGVVVVVALSTFGALELQAIAEATSVVRASPRATPANLGVVLGAGAAAAGVVALAGRGPTAHALTLFVGAASLAAAIWFARPLGPLSPRPASRRSRARGPRR